MAFSIVSFSVSVLSIVLVLVTSIYFFMKYVSYNYWRKQKIVFEKPMFPFGNLTSVFLGKLNPGEYFQELYEKYKKDRFVGIYALWKPILLINDPDLIRIVLTKEFPSFHNRGFFHNERIEPLSGHLFLMTGTKWKNLRIKMTPIFTSGKMKLMFDTVKNIGDDLIKCLKDHQENDVEIKDVFARFTTDSITSTAFGVQANSLKNPKSEFRYYGLQAFEPRPVMNALFMLAPRVLEILRIPYFSKDLRKFFVDVFQDNLKARKKQNVTKPRDFFDLLMQLMKNGYVVDDEGNSPPFDDKKLQGDGKLKLLEAVAQSFVFFVAGFETSSSTATFCLYELAKNTEIQNKLRSEIMECLKKHGGLTYESLNDMNYLTKVVNETLRKYPVVLNLNRVCTRSIDLPTTDLHIKKGTDVIISVLGLHRDPEIWPDPEKFDPERFSPENIASRHPYAYLPFGEGPRICIGMRFGIMQTKIAIISALITSRFKISPRTLLPLQIDPGSFVYATKHPIYLKQSFLTT